MSRATFVLDGIEYFACHGPLHIVLVTHIKISQEQYDEAYAFAKRLFESMDRDLRWSIRKTADALLH